MNIQDYKYKIELHAHTKPVSGCSSIRPERMVEIIKELGCDAVVITNHCRTGSDKNFAEHYLNDYRRTKEAGDKCGLNVILGMELYASGDDRRSRCGGDGLCSVKYLCKGRYCSSD